MEGFHNAHAGGDDIIAGDPGHLSTERITSWGDDPKLWCLPEKSGGQVGVTRWV